jgi:hypothetical protein
VSEDQCSVVGEGGQAIKEMKLDSRAGKSLDTVDAGRMKQDILRGLGAEPADVNTQIAAGRRTGSQFQAMEPAARLLYLGTKSRPCFLVLLGKV